MSLIKKIMSRRRVRSLSKQVSSEPSARNYLILTQELARLSAFREVVRVCQEGLELHPGNADLKRMLGRVAALERGDRMRQLQRLLLDCPRPALWREACELLIESGSFPRAEDLAKDWLEKTEDGEARLFMALARSERYFADLQPEDGRVAFEYCAAAKASMPEDERVLRCHLRLALRCGASGEARRSLARLLELHPGDPILEARFRSILAMGSETISIEKALRKVEETGRLAGDTRSASSKPRAVSARPVLKEIESHDQVHAAFYVRGGTALVQGPKGATAERLARTMRELIQSTGSASRRLGLGRVVDVQFEGDFGSMLAVTGEHGSSAMWSSGVATQAERTLLCELADISHSEAQE